MEFTIRINGSGLRVQDHRAYKFGTGDSGGGCWQQALRFLQGMGTGLVGSRLLTSIMLYKAIHKPSGNESLVHRYIHVFGSRQSFVHMLIWIPARLSLTWKIRCPTVSAGVQDFRLAQPLESP